MLRLSCFFKPSKKLFLLTAFVVFTNVLIEDSCFAGPKIEVRFTAIVNSYRKNFQENQPFDTYSDSAGYDILWRGQVTSKGFKPTFEKMLFGSGKTSHVYKTGPGTCTGTLSVDPDGGVIDPGATVKNGKVTMSIQLPHVTPNILDKSQDVLSKCRVASAELATATCFNPTRECFTIGGSINPDITILPTDETPFSKFLHHKDYAYFQFADLSPDTSQAFSYTINNEVFDHLGNLTDTYKVVAAGFFTVRSSEGPDSPTPVDPSGFLSGGTPPNDATTPTNPFGGGGVDYVGPVVSSWMSAFGPHIRPFCEALRDLNSVGSVKIFPRTLRTLINSVAGISFETETKSGTISTSVAGSTPASGIFQIKIKALPSDKAKGYKLTIPKKAAGTNIVQDVVSPIAFSIDPGSLKLIQSGKAAKVFVTIRLTPSTGKKTFEKHFSVGLKKKK